MDAFTSNACTGLAPNDCAELERAAVKLLDARNIVIKLSESLADAATSAGGNFAGFLKDKTGFDPVARIKEKYGVDVPEKIQNLVHDLLWNVQSGAMLGMDVDGTGDRWGWFHKALVMASGASGGFFGLPGLLWDLPITTTNIMRSVADIARSFPEEHIDSDDTKRACIEVFALGSPLSDDDEAEVGYWAARAGINHATLEALIKVVAARFGVVISDKVLVQSVPIVGALAGAALNYAFIDYYQEMARVHFAVRGVERRAPDPTAVRPCFSKIVGEVRKRRMI